MLNATEEYLSVLGIAFTVKTKQTIISPEEALVSIVQLKEFQTSRRYYSLLCLATNEYSNFLRLEVIFHYSDKLDQLSSGFLAAIIQQLPEANGASYKKLLKKLKQQSKGSSYFLSSEKRVELQGKDTILSKFGIYTIPFQKQHKVKLISRAKLLKSNTWYRNRLVFGVGLRADIATLRDLKLVDKSYGAMKKLKSSKASTYKIWKELEEFSEIREA
ncbi:hypothetical protein A9Q84_13625 [Halobacteriovorax marinus]|uniref:Uncharacterized protein n=1 Tax=Halobacteriovorax marinus TaxID=97084 RepID=A0A1Y5FEF3_9BACT|nr:hypothetical protein A9Q84_13625 [Halobacteriovorax marinus]